MSAAAALSMAREASVSISLEGNDLMLEAAYAPSPQLLEMISRHKSEIVALLRPAMDRWSTVEWEAFFQERLRIAECSMPTQEAGVLAFEQCVVQWLTGEPDRQRAVQEGRERDESNTNTK